MNDEMRRMAWKMEKLQEQRSAAAEMLRMGADRNDALMSVCVNIAWSAPDGVTCGDVRAMTDWVMVAAGLGVEEKE